MRNKQAPEDLDAQTPDNEGSDAFQLFTSLLRFRSGWFANHALRTAGSGFSSASRFTFTGPPSLSLGR